MILSRENLERYAEIEREILRIERKLKYYAERPVCMTHGVVQSSMQGFPYAPTHLVVGGCEPKSDEERNKKIQNLLIQLSEKKREYEEFELEIDIAIEEIKNLEIKQILQYKYIEKRTDFEIGAELGYERSTISKKLDKFFQNQHSHNSHSECGTMIV